MEYPLNHPLADWDHLGLTEARNEHAWSDYWVLEICFESGRFLEGLRFELAMDWFQMILRKTGEMDSSKNLPLGCQRCMMRHVVK